MDYVFAVSYTATQNGNWNASSTWGGSGVPSASDDAALGNFTVTLTADAACNNITTASSWGLIMGSYNLTVSGNFTSGCNAGTVTATSGYLIFNGTTQTITLSCALTVPNIRLSNSTSVSIGVQNNLNVTGNFDCQTGSSTFTDNTSAYNSGKLYITGTCTAPNCTFTVTNDHVAPGLDFSASTSNPVQVKTIILNQPNTTIVFGSKNVSYVTAFSGTNTAGITFTSGSASPSGTTYYSKNSTDLSTLSNWNSNTNGTSGSAPSNFTGASDIFIVQAGHSCTMGSNTAITGTLTVNGTLAPVAAAVISGGTLNGSGTVKVTRTSATADFSSQYTETTKTLTSLTVDYSNVSGNQTISAVTYYNLLLSNTSGTQNAANNLSVSGSLTITAGGTLAMGSYTLGTPSSVSIGLSAQITGSGLITLGGNVDFTGAGAGTTIATPIDLGSADRTFTVADGSDNDDVVLSGILSGSRSIIKAGSGRLRLNAINTFTGTTTINAGQLYAGNNSALGTTGSGTTVTSGQRLAIGSGITVGSEALSISGTGGGTYGAIDNISSNNTYGGVITLAAASMIGSRAGILTLSNTITGTYDLSLYTVGDIVASGGITIGSGTITQTGSGNLTLSGTNTNTGIITSQAGTLKIGSTNALNGNPWISIWGGAVLDFNGYTPTGTGTIQLQGTGIASGGALTNTSATAVTYASPIQIMNYGTDNVSIIANNGAINLTSTSNITNSGNGSYTTINLILGGSTGGSLSGGLVDGTKSISLTKQDAGVWVLNGNNTYTGTTVISGGILRLGAADRISNSSNMQLNGGTFSTGATTGYNETIGTLNLNANSTIALGSGSHTITFSNSSAVSWAGSTLTITGWTGTAGSTGTAGKIFFGASTGTLTAGQLAKISFTGYTGTPVLLSSGELVPPSIQTITSSQSTRTGFTYNFGSGPSSEQSYTIAGSNLTANIVITPPTDYEISTGTAGSFVATNPITLTQSGGTVSATTIYVRLKSGLAANNYNSEDITHTSTGATNVTVTCSGNVVAVPSVAVSSVSQVGTANLGQNTLKNPISAFSMAISTTNATLNTISFTTTGTYVSGDVTNFKLWYGTGALGAAAQLGSSITGTTGPGTYSFSSLSQSLTSGTTYNFWITADITTTAVATHTLTVSSIPNSDISFTLASKSGSVTVGGTQTLIATTPAITLSDNSQVSSATLYNNTTNNIVSRFQLAVSSANSAIVNTVAFTTTGTAVTTTDLTNFKLWYCATNVFGSASVLSTLTTSLSAGTHSFTGLTQGLSYSTTGYFWITADIPNGATSARTVAVSSIANTDITFASGSKSGSASAAGTQTISTAVPVDYYYVGADNGDWSTASNWKTVSCGGSVAATPPTASDNVYLTCGPNGNTVKLTANSSCASLTITSYQNEVDLAGFNLTVSGNVVIGSSNNECRVTSSISGSSSTLSIGGNLSIASYQSFINITGFNITVSGNVAISSQNSYINTNNGNVTVNGNVTFSNLGAYISVGTGNATIIGTYTNTAGADSKIDWSTGTVKIAGNIAVSKQNSVEPLNCTSTGYFEMNGSSQSFTTSGSNNVTIPKFRQPGTGFTKAGSPTIIVSNILDYNCFASYPSGVTISVPANSINQYCGTPNITLSSSNPSVAAASVAQSSTKNPLLAFSLAITTNNSTLNQIDFSTTNTAADVTKYQLWYNSSNDITTATQIGTDITASLGTGSHSFTSLTQALAVNTTCYFWVTANLAANPTAVIGHTISASAITTANITVSSGNKSGTAYAGGNQIIAAAGSLSVSTATLTNFNYAGSGPSRYQSFTLSGSNLLNGSGNITVVAPTDYIVCNTSNGTYGSTTTIAYSSATLAATSVYVKLKSGLTAGNTYNNETITFSGGGYAGSTTVTCSGGVGHVYYLVASGSWTTAATWRIDACGGSTSGYPSQYDSVYAGCASYAGLTVTMPSDVTVGALYIDGKEIVDMNGYNLTVNGDVKLGITNTWTLGQGMLDVRGGILNVGGDLTLGYNNDMYGLRWDAGTINVAGNLICSDGGGPSPLVVGDSPSENVSIKPGGGSGSSTLSGTYPIPTYAGYIVMTGTNKTIQVNAAAVDLVNIKLNTSVSKTGTGILYLSGDLNVPNASTTLTSSSGTVELDGTITNGSNMALAVTGGAFYDYTTTASPTLASLSVSGGSTLVVGGSTATTLNVSGNVDVTNGTLTLGSASYAKNLAISGELTVGASGTVNVGAYNTTHTLTATSVSNSGTIDLYTSASQICNATFTPSANFTLAGILDFNDLTFAAVGSTKSTTLGSDFTVHGNLSIGTNNSIIFGLTNRSISVVGNLSGVGLIDMTSSTHTLYLGGATNSISTFTTDANASTVNYNKSGDQSVFSSANYRNLTLSGSGTKTLSGAITINNDLTISAGTFDISASNYAISSKGNVVNNGTFTARSGVFTMNGTVDQTISGSNSLAFYDLTINKASNKVILSKDASSTHTLTLSTGNIDVGAYSFTATSISGGSASSYIATTTAYNASPAGYLKLLSLNGTEKTLPVGTATTYNPCYITNSGTAQNFSVRVFTGVYANGLSGTIAADLTKLVNRTWEITPTVQTGISAIIKLQWNASDEGVSFASNRTTAGLSKNRHIGGDDNWHVQASTAVLGSGPYTIANTTGITTFSTFGVGIDGSTLPIELSSFKAIQSGDNVKIKWTTQSETNNDYFTLEKSIDGETWDIIFTCDGAGTSTKINNYSFIDEDPYSGVNFYRLKQTDLDGKYSYSSIENVCIKNDSLLFSVFPNPGYLEDINVIIKGVCVETVTIIIADIYGRQICSGFVEISKSLISIKLSDLCIIQPGTYFVSIKGNNLLQNIKMIIK